MHQDKQDVAPSRLSVAPCSDPSRRGLATRRHVTSMGPGRRNELEARTKELHEIGATQ